MQTKVLIVIITIFFWARGTAQQTHGGQLFNDAVLHEIHFDDVDTDIFSMTKDYQQLKMTIDGHVVDSIGFKRKGNISAYYSPDKFGIKVKTNKYVSGKKYDGIKEFTLHINYQDPTMLREKLTYDLCFELGLFSLRTAFAKVYINNDYWGLYTIVEGKDEMFKHIFDNRDMDAVESIDFGDLCYIGTNPDEYNYETNGGLPTYQLENGSDETAWPRFASMIDIANNTPNDTYLSTVSDVLNIEDFLTYQALNVYLMNMDSYIVFRGNQIFMYDEQEELWQILPWDFNASLGLWDTNNYSPSSYPILPSAITEGCVAGKINAVPELKSYYFDAICQLNTVLGDTTAYFGKIDNWYNQIKEAVYEDTRKHFTNADFENGIGYGYHHLFGENIPALKTFISERLAIANEGLLAEGYACQTVGINEVDEKLILEVFPNPASEFVTIQTISNDTHKMHIYNAVGQRIMSLNKHTGTIDISHLEKGVYIVVVEGNNGVHTTKFIKS